MSDRQARLIGCAVVFAAGVMLSQNSKETYFLAGFLVALASGIAFFVDWLQSWRQK